MASIFVTSSPSRGRLVVLKATLVLVLLVTLVLLPSTALCPLRSAEAHFIKEELPSIFANINWGYTTTQPVRNTSRLYYSTWKTEYLSCGGISTSGVLTDGDTQSPINFQQVPVNANLKPISFDVSTTIRNLSMMILPQTKLSFEVAATSSASYDSTANNIASMRDANTNEFYTLHHIDVKTPSEHTFGGGHRDMEVQLVYQSHTLPSTDPGYNYIISATFIATPLSRSEFVNTLISGGVYSSANFSDAVLRPPVGSGVEPTLASPLLVRKGYKGSRLRLSTAAPLSRNYYRYYGSLTEPPCSENAIWNVYTEPAYMSMEQLTTIRRLLQLDIAVADNKPMHLNYTKILYREDGKVIAGAGLALSPKTVQLGNHRPIHLTPTPPQPLATTSASYQQVSNKLKVDGVTHRPYTIAERYEVTQFKDLIGDQLLAHETVSNNINEAMDQISAAAITLSVLAIPTALLALVIGRA